MFSKQFSKDLKLDEMQLKMLKVFYDDYNTQLENVNISRNFSDINYCKKRALELFLLEDKRIFGTKYSLMGTKPPKFSQDPLYFKTQLEYLTNTIFYDILGMYSIEEDHLLKGIMRFPDEDNFFIHGETFYEVYRIVAARDGLKYIKDIDLKYMLCRPVSVLFDNIRDMISEATLPNIDTIFEIEGLPQKASSILAENKSCIKIPVDKIDLFDYYWENALEMHEANEVLLIDEEAKAIIKKITYFIGDIGFRLVKSCNKLLPILKNEMKNQGKCKAKIIRECCDTRDRYIKDLKLRVTDKIPELSIKLQALMLKNLATKLLEPIIKIQKPSVIFLDVSKPNNVFKLPCGIRMPFKGVRGTIIFSDGTTMRHEFLINLNKISVEKYKKLCMYNKYSMKMLETKFLNSALNTIFFKRGKNTLSISHNDFI